MNTDERQFLLTAVWMFMRHGQPARARALCEALVEEDPRDGVAAVALAELLLDESEAARAIEILRAADFSSNLLHAEAVLETRALRLLGRNGEASARWQRYLEARKGSSRLWVS
jgi:predicted Zn-dependent protease